MSDEGYIELPDSLIEPSFESEAIANIESEIVREAIKKLGEKQRRRLMLHFFGGLNFKEIGVAENVSKMAISYSVRAAIQELRKILEKINF